VAHAETAAVRGTVGEFRKITTSRQGQATGPIRASRDQRRLAENSTCLTGFFAIAKSRPAARILTPCAAPRSASSRIILENKLRLPLRSLFARPTRRLILRPKGTCLAGGVIQQLMSFFNDRLKVYCVSAATRYDLIDAVFCFGSRRSPPDCIPRRGHFKRSFDTEEGKNLLAGYRRATNILRAEEKKRRAGSLRRRI